MMARQLHGHASQWLAGDGNAVIFFEKLPQLRRIAFSPPKLGLRALQSREMFQPRLIFGSELSSIEKNVLRYRAFEVVLILFYVEDLREFVVESLRATDRIAVATANGRRRLPDTKKGDHKAAWQILVDDGIITDEESADIRRLVDYRNTIAHELHEITRDVGRNEFSSGQLFDLDAIQKLQRYREKISSGMSRRYIISASLRGSMFEAAERTYREELDRLRRKIDRQFLALRVKIDAANLSLAQVSEELWNQLEPGHPRHCSANGKLNPSGVACCHRLFEAGADVNAVSHVMRISARSIRRRYDSWATTNAAGTVS